MMKIGVTYNGNEAKHQKYVSWLGQGTDVEIVMLAADRDGENLFEECDALVLSGGIDMHPDYYKGASQYPNMPSTFDEKRDQFEWLILGKAWKRAIPVLGVCRGLQLINCFFGGDLFQDGGEPTNSIHRSFKTDQKQYDRAHALNIVSSSLLSDIAGVDRAVVNSAHHQSINILGEGLQANAFSDDKIVEGIELADKHNRPFFLGVQWHPERMVEMSLQEAELCKSLREHFLKAIKELK